MKLIIRTHKLKDLTTVDFNEEHFTPSKGQLTSLASELLSMPFILDNLKTMDKLTYEVNSEDAISILMFKLTKEPEVAKQAETTYESTINGQTYLVFQSMGYALNTVNGQQITLEELARLIKKAKNPFSNQWTFLEKGENPRELITDDILFQGETEIMVDNRDGDTIRNSYQIIAFNDEEGTPVILRALIGKYDVSNDKELEIINDSSENSNVSLIHGLSNSLLWYCNQVDGLDGINSLADKLGFTSTGSFHVKNDLIIMRTQIDGEPAYYFKQVVNTENFAERQKVQTLF